MPLVAGSPRSPPAPWVGNYPRPPPATPYNQLDSIMESYDRRMRPGGNASVSVAVSGYVLQLNSVDLQRKEVEVMMYLRQFWTDERLAALTETVKLDDVREVFFSQKLGIFDFELFNKKIIKKKISKKQYGYISILFHIYTISNKKEPIDLIGHYLLLPVLELKKTLKKYFSLWLLLAPCGTPTSSSSTR